jgi:hypothetical protein
LSFETDWENELELLLLTDATSFDRLTELVGTLEFDAATVTDTRVAVFVIVFVAEPSSDSDRDFVTVLVMSLVSDALGGFVSDPYVIVDVDEPVGVVHATVCVVDGVTSLEHVVVDDAESIVADDSLDKVRLGESELERDGENDFSSESDTVRLTSLENDAVADVDHDEVRSKLAVRDGVDVEDVEKDDEKITLMLLLVEDERENDGSAVQDIEDEISRVALDECDTDIDPDNDDDLVPEASPLNDGDDDVDHDAEPGYVAEWL